MAYNNKKVGMFDLSVILIVLVVCIMAFAEAFGISPNYYSDQKSGHITSLSHQGMFADTYGGVLDMGGLRKELDSEGNGTIVPNTINFSVSDPAVFEILKKKEEAGEYVTLVYTKWLVHPFPAGSNYIIKEVK